MLQDKSLERITFQQIHWEKEGTLYRGHCQEYFESRTLERMAEGRKPSYWGSTNLWEEKITFCSRTYMEGWFYARKSFFRYARPLNYYFTTFPIIMEIETEKYKDRLYKSQNGEGLVILGEIDLEDIKVLYSSRFDALEERNPELKLGPLGRGMIEGYKENIKAYKEMKNLPGEDLLTKFEKDKEETLARLCFRAYIPRYGLCIDREYTKEETDLVLRYLEVLRKKLSGEKSL